MSEEMEVAESPAVENDITLDTESHDLPEESAEHQEGEQGEIENDTASDSSPDIAPEQDKNWSIPPT